MNRRNLFRCALGLLAAALPWRRHQRELPVDPAKVYGHWVGEDFDGEKIPDRSGNGHHLYGNHDHGFIRMIVMDRVAKEP